MSVALHAHVKDRQSFHGESNPSTMGLFYQGDEFPTQGVFPLTVNPAFSRIGNPVPAAIGLSR